MSSIITFSNESSNQKCDKKNENILSRFYVLLHLCYNRTVKVINFHCRWNYTTHKKVNKCNNMKLLKLNLLILKTLL